MIIWALSSSEYSIFATAQPGIAPQIGSLQNIPYEAIPGWRSALADEGRILARARECASRVWSRF